MSQASPYGPPTPGAAPTYPAPPLPTGQKSFLATWLLSLLVGGLGIDRFYLGKVGTGILKLVTFGGFGIWSLVDLIITLAGKQTDKKGQPLQGYGQHKLVALIVTAVLLVGGIIVSASSVAASVSAVKNATPISTAPASQAKGADTGPATTPPAQATQAAPTAPKVATQTFTGTGDDIKTANLAGAPAIVTFTCPACDGNTVLKTNGGDSLLVNTIGAYTGSHIVDTSNGSVTSEFTVQATGNWTLTIADITTIKPTSGVASGHGDQVVFLSGTSTKAAITNQGESNFVVNGYGGSFPELAVNTIGSYKGTVQLTAPGFVQVTSSGDWTITPQ
ncbi:TM2 domain-containing protein [Arthrobacter sp. GN70]|uniref:TM2 domain-containing protein n=2 Tax=Arthrobacter TaxID=1663 RepID=A0A4R5L2A6_9MICC|nr:TM2 domain-containing protein [Arthrobacter sp. GN70]TDG01843.1 TM2 domain-containing protein [Arthrobacter terricola]